MGFFYAYLKKFNSDLNNPFEEDFIPLYKDINQIPEKGAKLYRIVPRDESKEIEYIRGKPHISFENFKSCNPEDLAIDPLDEEIEEDLDEETKMIHATRFRGNRKNNDTDNLIHDSDQGLPISKAIGNNPMGEKLVVNNFPLSLRKIHKPKSVKDPDRGLRYYTFQMSYSDSEAEMIDSLRIRYKLSTSGMFRLLLHAIYNSNLTQIPNKF